MKKILYFLVLIFIANNVMPQDLSCLNTLNHIGGESVDIPTKFIQIADGGYLVVGYTSSSVSGTSRGNFYVAKLDSARTLIWQKRYGGSRLEVANDVVEVADNYIVVGYTESDDEDVQSGNTGQRDWWIIKVDANGNLLWENTFGSAPARDDEAKSVVKTFDGQIIVVGYAYAGGENTTNNYGLSDWIMLKINIANGDILWQKNLGGSASEIPYKIISTSDSNFVIAGFTISNDNDIQSSNNGEMDIWVVKTDTSGNILWETTIGGEHSEKAYSVIESSDENYYLCGYSLSDSFDLSENYGQEDYLVAKLSSQGEIIWVKNYGGTETDVAKSMVETSMGNFIVTGVSMSNDIDVSGHHGYTTYTDVWNLLIDSSGEKLWEFSYGSNTDDGGMACIADSDLISFAGYVTSATGDVDFSVQETDVWLYSLEIRYFENIFPDTLILNVGDALRLSAFVRGADDTYKYQWFKNDTLLVLSTDSVLYIPYMQTQYSGVYYCSVENSCNTMISPDVRVIVRNGDFIESLTSNVVIYPNPVSEYFFVKNIQIQKYPVMCYIFNNLGQCVKMQRLISENDIINVSYLPQGYYIIKLKSEDNLFITKMQKR